MTTSFATLLLHEINHFGSQIDHNSVFQNQLKVLLFYILSIIYEICINKNNA